MSAKVPAVVRICSEALAAGKCVVIGLQSTGEARTEEAVTKYVSIFLLCEKIHWYKIQTHMYPALCGKIQLHKFEHTCTPPTLRFKHLTSYYWEKRGVVSTRLSLADNIRVYCLLAFG